MTDEDTGLGPAVDAPTGFDPTAAPPPVFAPEAYSAHTTTLPVEPYEPSRDDEYADQARGVTWWAIALAAVAGIAALTSMFFLGVHLRNGSPAAPAVTPTAVTATEAPQPEPRVPTVDEAFLASLKDHGISSDSIAVQQRWMEFGHHVCWSLAPPNSQSVAALTAAMVNANNNHSGDMPQFSMEDATNLVLAATMAYCSQYSGIASGAAPSTPEPPSTGVVTSPATPNSLPVSVDDRYWDALVSAGLSSNNKAGSIGQGHQVCAELSGGTSYADLIGRMGMTPQFSGGVVRTAVSVICPSNAGVLP